jgi:hypothetical protein
METAAINAAAAMTNPNVRIAIIATAPDILKLAEAYCALKFSPNPKKIFTDLDEAKRWVAATMHLKSRFHPIGYEEP